MEDRWNVKHTKVEPPYKEKLNSEHLSVPATYRIVQDYL